MEAVMTGTPGEFEVRWEGAAAGTPEQGRDAITARTADRLSHIDDEPRVGGRRQHTAFHHHSLGEHVRHFARRDAACVTADAPEASADGGGVRLRDAPGVPVDVAAGDRVRLTSAGLEPVGDVDHLTPAFPGVRTADALYRFYGRDVWGRPVGVAHHMFAGDVDAAATGAAWQSWLTGVFTTEGSSREVS